MSQQQRPAWTGGSDEALVPLGRGDDKAPTTEPQSPPAAPTAPTDPGRPADQAQPAERRTAVDQRTAVEERERPEPPPPPSRR
ncbi:MAG TPA: hypothetical protein VIJ05_01495, partial [Actinomycetes bacterium]